jgi:hypothetical protein
VKRWTLAVLVLALTGCSGFINRQAASSTYRILEQSMVAARRQPDLELARDAIPGGLMQLEAFALAYPDHGGFRTLHTETFCQYVVGFVFDDWEDASLGGRTADTERLTARLGPLTERCIDANLGRLPPAWRAAWTSGPDAVIALLPAVTRAQVPSVLWLATASSVRLALAPLQQFSRLPMIEAMLARSTQLAPGFHDAEAEVLLATLLAAKSRMFGGDDGSAQFARARKLTGDGALIVDVMAARGAAMTKKDRVALEATLERLIATDVSRWPERRLSNELALRKARRYLAASSVLVP